MIILLAVVLAGIAARLWSIRREPADRLRRVRRSLHPAGFPEMSQEVETSAFSLSADAVRDPSAHMIRGAPPRMVRDTSESATRGTAGRKFRGASERNARGAFGGKARGASEGSARSGFGGKFRGASEGKAHGAFEGKACELRGRRRPGRSEIAVALAPGLAAFLAVGGLPGAVAGVAGFGIALVVLWRREPPELRGERRRVTADLPLAADLMVACLRAGQPITGAIDVTVEAVGGPLGERLAWVSGQLRLGAAPESAWQALESERSLAPLARAMSRAALSGAPVADVLIRLSDDSRRAARAASSAAAQRVGVQVVAPLGLCFLPAFVFLGIIPIVAGLAGEVLLP
ncbi:type II secretion system F family protein [Streptosporangium sp. V21-05]|uniref:type II secretion system F family protein n=1 Tax=Streptosporangium sp. V21-05 TaxID=3446115 RepID=UPI003F53E081